MKKNVAGQTVGAQMISATDGSDFTGSVTCYVTGNGGTQAAGGGTVTHKGNGYHSYAPTQAETNYDHVAFTFKGTGAVTATMQVYPSFPQSGDAFGLIGATGSGLTSLASAANLATVANYVDTEVAAILAAVDTEVAAIKTKTDLLPSASPGAAGGLFIAGSNAATSVNITGNITGNVSGSVGSVTSGVTLAAVTHTGAVIPTVTDLSNLPSIPAGWLTAAGIASGALNGKGDWNVGKSGYTLLQAFPANFASMLISVAGLVDIVQGDQIETNLDVPVSSVSGGGGGGVADWTANEKTAIRSILGIPASGTTPDDPTVGILDTIRDAANAVKAKTDNLPADPADASDIAASFTALNTKVDAVDDFLDTEIAAIKVKTDALPADPADASDIAAAFAVTNAKIDAVDDLVDTEVAAIKTDTAAIKLKTDALPADPADASDITASFTALSAKVDAVDDLLDTEMPALTAAAASIQADTNDIQARLPAALVAGRMDVSLGAIDGSTTAVSSFKRGVKANVIGTVGVGSSTSSIVTSAIAPAGSVADKFKGRTLIFADDTTTANLRGQATDILGVSSAANPVLTVTPLTTAPASTDTFVIV